MTASTSGALVEDNVIDVLKKSQLDEFLNKFIFNLQVRRFEHFSHIHEKDMRGIGLQPEQIRMLREQTKKMSREMWNRSEPKQVFIPSDSSNSNQNPIDERTLIPNEQIKLYEKLGEGSFAVVKRGVWMQNDGRKVDVAVKILRDIAPTILEDLRIEASHLLKLHHPSLIRLYGIVQQPAMMVFELCEGGSLLDRLRDDNKSVLIVTQLLEYSVQIAKALQFLETKHCVHRDVAARNILLSKDEQSVKICDFGLMRALKENERTYTMGPQKRVPFAWCPPEALKHRKFSHASDVWSYGVTLWEIFTLGEEPWIGCRAIDVLKHIDAGERLEKPQKCSKRIYEIMLNCWKPVPDERIKFGSIREDLKAAAFLNAKVREAYKSIQPGTLQLDVNDDVVIIDLIDQDYYGQSKKSRLFGTFPRTSVFVGSNEAATSIAVTPQKLPSVPTVKLPPTQNIPIVHNRQIAIARRNGQTSVPRSVINNDNSINKPTLPAGNSRISMPVQGSFIHTGHGDGLGGNSWGSPSAIEEMYLKNPVKGVPLSRSNGAEIINSKLLLSNGTRNVSVAPSTSSDPQRLSLQLTDFGNEFERALDGNFSPSSIELPQASVNASNNISEVSVHTNDEIGTMISNNRKSDMSFDIRGNQLLQPLPVLEKPPVRPHSVIIAPTNTGSTTIPLPDSFHIPSDVSLRTDEIRTRPPHVASEGSRLDTMASSNIANLQKNLSNGNISQNSYLADRSRIPTEMMRQRPASSIGLQNGTDLRHFDPMLNRNMNVIRPVSVQNMPINQNVNIPSASGLPCLVPTPIPANHMAHSKQQAALAQELKGSLLQRQNGSNSSNVGNSISNAQSVTSVSNGHAPHPQVNLQPIPTHQLAQNTKQNQSQILQQNNQRPVEQPKIPPPNSTTQVRPAVQTSAAPKKPTDSSQVANTLQANVVNRRSVSTTAAPASDIDRRSKIDEEIRSLLPTPSPLLFGAQPANSSSSTRSNVPTATTVSSAVSRVSPPASQVNIPPPKKAVEPVLSMNSVLQPTRITPVATIAKNQATPDVAQAVTKNIPAPIQNEIVAPPPQPQVPLYNITNSNSGMNHMYPQLHSYPNYSIGFGNYGNNHGGYPPYYNPYNNAIGFNTQIFRNNLPPLVSENRTSPVNTQPLAETDIQELLGTSSQPAQRAPVNISTSSSSSANSDVSMVEKMEILYREANFTKKSRCDTMVAECSGNTEIALKRLKEWHLVHDLKLTGTIELARQALERRNYDLVAAANVLLG